MAFPGHDKRFLVLLYKVLFAPTYPQPEFNVLIQPTRRPIEDLYYIPDILIAKGKEVVLWVELGNLPYDKATKVIEFIGEYRFRQIPYNHPLFDLHDLQTPETFKFTGTQSATDFDNFQRRNETAMLEKALAKHRSVNKAAEAVGLTPRQFRYRVEKYGINGRKKAISKAIAKKD